MSADSAFTLQCSRPQTPRPWACRECKCDQTVPCAVTVGMTSAGRPPTDLAAHTERSIVKGHCYPVGDVCSRCHNEQHPTVRQIHELQRIIGRLGPTRILWTTIDHHIVVQIEGRSQTVAIAP